MSTRLNWDVVRGDSETLPFIVTILGSTDITNAEVRFTARFNGAPVLNKANLAAGGADAQVFITDAAAGTLEVYLVTTDLPIHLLTSGGQVQLQYDLEVTMPSGTVKTPAYGVITVLMDQTR